MLERFSEIQGIGLLHEVNGKALACRKATLIYGDNGRGKSTLASVLRSLSTNDPEAITRRQTVDGTLPPKVSLQFSNGRQVTFRSGAWSDSRPKLLVFDSDFIERNVHSGGSVSTDHRKNLLQFALGEPAVLAREAVEVATAAARTASERVQSASQRLLGYHVGMPQAVFEAISPVADADIQIAALQLRIAAAADIASTLAKPIPAKVPVPELRVEEAFQVLRLELRDLHADAEQAVRAHVSRLGNKPMLEGWLSQGQSFGDAAACPYCGQNTEKNDLIQAYQTHFDSAYRRLKEKVADLQRTISSSTNPALLERFDSGVKVAATIGSIWSDRVQSAPIMFSPSGAETGLSTIRELLSNLVSSKLSSPTEAFGTQADISKIEELWREVTAPMHIANAAIEATAARIAAYKDGLAKTDAAALARQIGQLKAAKRRHDPAVDDLFKELAAAREASVSAEKTKLSQREALDALMIATLQTYEKAINSLLTRFGAAFRIEGMAANFRGLVPRSEYGLLLRGRPVALEGADPSFSTALSEGDRRTLAFAFFVASALDDPTLGSKTVVIDDPMCSLDLNRKHTTKTVLRQLHSKADQLIVLAHDPFFIRDVRDTFLKENPLAPLSVFGLRLAQGGYSEFAAFDLDRECESAYFQHHRLLNDFVSGLLADSRSVAKAIRPMLEGYLHRRFPGRIPKSLLFGGVVVQIRDAKAPSPLVHARNLVEALNEINDYAGQFHHDSNPGSADTVVIVDSELKTFVERALHIVHSGTPV